MGRLDVFEHGTNGLVLTVLTAAATGSTTVDIMRGAPQNSNVDIGIRVAAFAGWGGTVTVTPHMSSADATGGAPVATSVGDLTASTVTANAGARDVSFDGASWLTIAVTGNTGAGKAVTVYCKSYGDVGKGAS